MTVGHTRSGDTTGLDPWSFTDGLARPHVVDQDIEAGYRAMSLDKVREKAANEWASELIDETW